MSLDEEYMKENDLRDFLFSKHKENLFELIAPSKKIEPLPKEDFPRISDILRYRAETKNKQDS